MAPAWLTKRQTKRLAVGPGGGLFVFALREPATRKLAVGAMTHVRHLHPARSKREEIERVSATRATMRRDHNGKPSPAEKQECAEEPHKAQKQRQTRGAQKRKQALFFD